MLLVVPDPGPLLDGITVLDFTRVLSGPYATRLLADLGARVIKVERPGEGDEMRRGYLQIEPGRDDQSTYFIRLNAGKLSVGIELGLEASRGLVRDLARVADVVVENFAPGVMAKLGCDHAALAAVKPDLVYCSISGFGQTGPLSRWPAFHHVINAISGIMALEQNRDPLPRVGYLQSADVLAGAHAFGAIVAALYRRLRTGQGAYLDVSMLEALIAADDISYGAVLNGGAMYPGPRAGMGIFEIGGRHLATQTVGAPQLWPRLVKLLGRPELLDDPRFATPMKRRENWPAIRDLLAEWLTGFDTVDEAQQALGAARIPSAPVLRPDEVVAQPHLAARRAFPAVRHPARGTARVTAAPFHVDGGPVSPAGPAPYLPGEHTEQVLRDILGYSASRIEELRTAGAI
jgi:crotonobetainyl-CoA:carnitine CoA-transferase CaiB-like acyl-CoA transferase